MRRYRAFVWCVAGVLAWGAPGHADERASSDASAVQATRPAPGRPFAPEDWEALRQIVATAVSPDGSTAAFLTTSLGDATGPLVLEVARPDGGEGSRFTLPPARVAKLRFSPDGRRLGALFVRGLWWEEDAPRWLRVLEVAEGRWLDLPADLGGRQIVDFTFSPDGSAIQGLEWRSGNEGKLIVFTLCPLAPGDAGCRDQAVINKRGWEASWSADGRQAVLCRLLSGVYGLRSPATLMLFDLTSGDYRALTGPEAIAMRPAYAPRGDRVAFVWGRETLRESPVRRDIWYGPTRPWRPVVLTGDFAPGIGDGVREPHELWWTPDGRAVVTCTHDGPDTPVMVFGVDGTTRRLLGAGLCASALSVASQRPVAVCSVEGPASPPRLVRIDLMTGRQEVLADPNAALRARRFGRSEVISWKTADGLTIEGLVTYPPASDGEKAPLIVIPPEALNDRQRTAFAASWRQLFAGRGYAVLEPNPRGSTGYGEPFVVAGRGDLAGRALDDILAGVDRLVEAGTVDRNRLYVFGQGFGGYLATMLAARDERFAAAATVGAPSDLVLYYEQTSRPGPLYWVMQGPPHTRGRLYRDRSPIHHAGQIRAPLLILFGEADEQVSPAHGHNLAAAIREAGGTAEVHVYPGVGHTCTDASVLTDALGRVDAWFRKHARSP